MKFSIIIPLLLCIAFTGCGKKLEEEKNKKNNTLDKESIDELHENKLYSAIVSGDSTLVRSALNKIKNINHQFKQNGETALTLAIKSNHFNIVKMLLDHNAPATAKNLMNEVPLHLAIKSDNNNISKIFINESTDFNFVNSQSQTPLELAIELQKEELAIRCVQYGANVNTRVSNGTTVALFAKRNRLFDLEKLISQVKEFKLKSAHERDFSNSIEQGEFNFIKFIFNTTSKKEVILSLRGKNALNKAVSISQNYQRTRMVNFLLNQGLKADGEEGDTLIPLYTAIKLDDSYIVGRLISAGADVNQYNYKLRTPLAYAVKMARLDCAEKLFSANAHIRNIQYTNYGRYYVIDACESLPKKRTYRNINTDKAQNYRDLEVLLNCD